MISKKLIIVGLIILVVLLIGYIVIGQYSQQQFLEGFQAGYKETIFQIAKQSLSCQLVPLVVDNQTIKLVNVDCLK